MPKTLFFSLLIGLLASPWLAAEPAAVERGEFKGADFFEMPDWFKPSFLDVQADVEEAAASGKRLMLYFHQNGCPYCSRLVKDNFTRSKEVIAYMQEHFDAIDMNMWGDRAVTGLDGKEYNEKSYAASLKVWFTPTILFFDEQGKVALRINGYYDPEKFMHVLRYVAEKKETEMSFAEYYKQFTAPKTRTAAALHSEPFFARPPYDLAALSKGKKPVAVFFEQADCADCEQMHKTTLKDADTLAVINGFHVIQLDRYADTPLVTPAGKQTTASQWADELNIAYAPSVVLFDGDKEIIRIEAFLKTFHVQSVFDYVLSGGYKTETSFQRYIEHRADRIRDTGKTVDLWD
ncbi:thioredoxin family protein [Sulfuriflexus sp.]|uniref:thioredoxin family protein n=1 Tax=Sulfuriflexus sp. TaxID=2015443 RepID=UPI0028CF156E|nr:thioredoxin fold domain-containing protein [Sulfuriflexus sp.]MDT8405022.1 thioredoxin fold domain-containing protein [Sulfuriflexus sp.]